MKLFVIAIASVVILIGAILYSERPAPPPLPSKTSQIHSESPPISIYNPDDVVKLSWSIAETKETLQIKRVDGTWSKISGPAFLNELDQWGTQRRVVMFSRLQLKDDVKVPNELGRLEFSFSNSKDKVTGIYDHQNFQFLSGPGQGKGFHLDSIKDLRDPVSEGLWGFFPHKLILCRPDKLKKIVFKDWSLEKTKSWFVVEKNKRDRARPERLKTFLQKICYPVADSFSTESEPGERITIFKIETNSSSNEIKKFANTFSAKGLPYFRSHDLTETLTIIHPADLRDPTSEEAKTAIDRKASQESRLDAIRKLRGNKSAEAVAALKEIIFEQTDIDLYRYEAVDTLTDIGTKEALKVIIDRLPQVGRSGFELRMARALAGAMGTFFKSDEKTPEDIRRPEVDALVEMALKKPPGK